MKTEIQFDHGRNVPCTFIPCHSCEGDLLNIIPDGLFVSCYWSGRSVLSLVSLLVSSSGVAPNFRLQPHPQEEDARYIELHRQCMNENKVMVVAISLTSELLLTPISGTSPNRTEFWGFLLTPKMTHFMGQLLSENKLALIFDLDETLISASSISNLESKIRVAQSQRQTITKTLESDGSLSASDRAQLRQQESAWQKEEELISQDLALLRQFSETNQVQVNGRIIYARNEVVPLEGGKSLSRPVIRLDEMGAVFTRIEPERPATSMIFRPRPGWNELRAYLAGEEDGKTRFDIYVCTAAERNYALEVWRILDLNEKLIPSAAWSTRIVNVSSNQKKELLRTLALPPALGQDSEVPFPMAIVVDDRLDVWEPQSHGCVLQVIPWLYYRDESLRHAGLPNLAEFSEIELGRVKRAIVSIRVQVYDNILHDVKPYLEKITTKHIPHMPLDGSVASILPPLSTVPKVYQSLKSNGAPFIMPTIDTAAPPPLATLPSISGVGDGVLAVPSIPGSNKEVNGMSLEVKQSAADPVKVPQRARAKPPHPTLKPPSGSGSKSGADPKERRSATAKEGPRIQTGGFSFPSMPLLPSPQAPALTRKHAKIQDLTQWAALATDTSVPSKDPPDPDATAIVLDPDLGKDLTLPARSETKLDAPKDPRPGSISNTKPVSIVQPAKVQEMAGEGVVASRSSIASPKKKPIDPVKANAIAMRLAAQLGFRASKTANSKAMASAADQKVSAPRPPGNSAPVGVMAVGVKGPTLDNKGGGISNAKPSELPAPIAELIPIKRTAPNPLKRPSAGPPGGAEPKAKVAAVTIDMTNDDRAKSQNPSSPSGSKAIAKKLGVANTGTSENEHKTAANAPSVMKPKPKPVQTGASDAQPTSPSVAKQKPKAKEGSHTEAGNLASPSKRKRPVSTHGALTTTGPTPGSNTDPPSLRIGSNVAGTSGIQTVAAPARAVITAAPAGPSSAPTGQSSARLTATHTTTGPSGSQSVAASAGAVATAGPSSSQSLLASAQTATAAMAGPSGSQSVPASVRAASTTDTAGNDASANLDVLQALPPDLRQLIPPKVLMSLAEGGAHVVEQFKKELIQACLSSGLGMAQMFQPNLMAQQQQQQPSLIALQQQLSQPRPQQQQPSAQQHSTSLPLPSSTPVLNTTSTAPAIAHSSTPPQQQHSTQQQQQQQTQQRNIALDVNQPPLIQSKPQQVTVQPVIQPPPQLIDQLRLLSQQPPQQQQLLTQQPAVHFPRQLAEQLSKALQQQSTAQLPSVQVALQQQRQLLQQQQQQLTAQPSSTATPLSLQPLTQPTHHTTQQQQSQQQLQQRNDQLPSSFPTSAAPQPQQSIHQPHVQPPPPPRPSLPHSQPQTSTHQPSHPIPAPVPPPRPPPPTPTWSGSSSGGSPAKAAGIKRAASDTLMAGTSKHGRGNQAGSVTHAKKADIVLEFGKGDAEVFSADMDPVSLITSAAQKRKAKALFKEEFHSEGAFVGWTFQLIWDGTILGEGLDHAKKVAKRKAAEMAVRQIQKGYLSQIPKPPLRAGNAGISSPEKSTSLVGSP